jgi:CRP-like cAMP-binding protein
MAGLLAGSAALSLPLGALLALARRPSTRIVAIVMAFGSGALIHAVVTELASDPAAHLVVDRGYGTLSAWLVLAAGFFVGGLLYVGVNAVVERFGGGVHRRRRFQGRALAAKRAQLAPILEALAGTELVQCLAPEEAEEVLPFLQTLQVDPGVVIFRRGDPSDALYIVQRGQFEIHYPNARGDDAAPTRLAPGDVVGGLGMIGGEPRTTTLVASEVGALLVLTRPDFERVLARLPRLRSTVTDLVARHLFTSAQARGRVDPTEWHRTAVRSLQHLSGAEAAAAAHVGGGGSPLAIFIGTLQDGIPESIAIGASFTSLTAFDPTFLVAVLLANLPEAVAGTSALVATGFSPRRVCLLWTGLVVGSALAGVLGYTLLYGASPASIAFLGALAGGGVVAMLATTMMPEAYEAGGAGVVPATIAGFVASLLLSIVAVEAR